MKHLSIILLLLINITNGFAQVTDSTATPTKNYNNNIQISTLCVLGIFSAQYERALGKDFSISLLGNYSYPYLKQTSDLQYEVAFVGAQIRYYLDKNTIKNNGLYTSAAYRFVYRHQYYPNIANNGNVYYKYSGLGAGLGYQAFVKKRIVLDLGAAFFYGFATKVKNASFGNEWGKSGFYNGNIQGMLTMNIGYRF